MDSVKKLHVDVDTENVSNKETKLLKQPVNLATEKRVFLQDLLSVVCIESLIYHLASQ